MPFPRLRTTGLSVALVLGVVVSRVDAVADDGGRPTDSVFALATTGEGEALPGVSGSVWNVPLLTERTIR